MIVIVCQHPRSKRHARDRKGNQRYRCLTCGKMFADKPASLLGDMRIPLDTAQLALRLVDRGNVGPGH